MISSTFNSKLGILEVKYSGRLNYRELKNFSDSLMKDKKIPRELKILTDVREGEYDLKGRDLPEIPDASNNMAGAFTFIKAAFIHNRPRETALSLIAEKRNTIPNYFHRVFSTEEAALSWLLGNIP